MNQNEREKREGQMKFVTGDEAEKEEGEIEQISCAGLDPNPVSKQRASTGRREEPKPNRTVLRWKVSFQFC